MATASAVRGDGKGQLQQGPWYLKGIDPTGPALGFTNDQLGGLRDLLAHGAVHGKPAEVGWPLIDLLLESLTWALDRFWMEGDENFSRFAETEIYPLVCQGGLVLVQTVNLNNAGPPVTGFAGTEGYQFRLCRQS